MLVRILLYSDVQESRIFVYRSLFDLICVSAPSAYFGNHFAGDSLLRTMKFD